MAQSQGCSGSWQSRQSAMERWYEQLAADPQSAADEIGVDYRPYAGLLASLGGVILDVGGGAGLAGSYLNTRVSYFVLDPSALWLADIWATISDTLSPSRATPLFIRGVGEQIPFSDCTFDSVLSFWSLNHVSDPAQCVVEVHRVLKPGGTALLVLEDMEPGWPDILTSGVRKFC